MGRKIPGKKHRKIKDPFIQRQRKEKLLELHINNPPSDPKQQEIPKSLLKIIDLKEKTKAGVYKRIRRKRKKDKNETFDISKALPKEIKQPGMDRPDRYLPNLNQRPNEDVGRYVKRVTNICNDIVQEVNFEKKYGVEVRRDLETGQITDVVKNNKRKKSKKMKLVEKRKLKKKDNVDDEKDFPKQEYIPFGEIVHQPPVNLKKPKKHIITNEKKCLLNSVLSKEKMEKRRLAVVEAFRQTKRNLKK